jgi:uncharacterized protein YdhG (YjbR/CyaY superfamily)
MKVMRKNYQSIDEYIASFPPSIQRTLRRVRLTIRKVAPDAQEAMTYGIPTFVYHENLVHFGGFQKHLGFYPTPDGISEFADELASYQSAKGSVQFPYDRPIPLDLITKIVRFRVKQIDLKVAAKRTARKKIPSRK